MLSERENIAIAELAVYILAIIAGIAVIFKHGFKKGRAWMYLVTFSGLRIASAIFEIESVNNPTDRTDATWTSILGSIGLSPLLLAASGLLRRVNDFITSGTSRARMLEILHLPILLALVIAIIGGTRISSSDTSKHSSGEDFEKGAVIIFLISYIAIVALALLTAAESGDIPRGEKRILYAVLAALPLLAVRLLYSILADFVDNSTFNILDGNATVQLCMEIIEEFIVTVFFLASGFLAPALDSLVNRPSGVPMNKFHGNNGVA
ncbi:hypothetical protein IMSHALPRED_006468 [Imshaugia aleurites]|uniref:DUF7702 domain-containing protein n=1 Tax=Imshaugia aleurites TaxID=172621 RepID=A0A8H3ILM0_9LECA|nr:hypothetical protein IMSHALPRED_006468 [Imshaugia aleurites]